MKLPRKTIFVFFLASSLMASPGFGQGAAASDGGPSRPQSTPTPPRPRENFGGNARGQGASSQATTVVMGGTGVIVGGAFVIDFCKTGEGGDWRKCIIGVAGMAGGVASMALGFFQGKEVKKHFEDNPSNCPAGMEAYCNNSTGGDTTGGFTAGTPTTGGDSTGSGSGSNSGGDGTTTTSGDGGGFTMDLLPPEVRKVIDENREALKDHGINPDDPNSFIKYNESKGNAAGGGGDMSGLMASLKPEERAELEKKVSDFISKYGASGVGFEEGGGARGGRDRGRGDNLADLLKNAMNQNQNENRNPSSVEGLSKLYNGEAVGVASDNIFNMISRRYSSKRKENQFIFEKEKLRIPASRSSRRHH